jgi:hypothetical protein
VTAEIRQIAFDLGAEVKIREHRRTGSGPRLTDGVVGEHPRRPQRRIAAGRHP